MTATEVRANAVVRLAEWHREGTLPAADADLMLRAIFTGVEPTVFCVHWRKLLELVAEEHDYRNTSRWEDTEPLSRIRDPYARSVASVAKADELRSEARDEARRCVMVATAHAAQKYIAGAA